jgi:hypothetical protein
MRGRHRMLRKYGLCGALGPCRCLPKQLRRQSLAQLAIPSRFQSELSNLAPTITNTGGDQHSNYSTANQRGPSHTHQLAAESAWKPLDQARKILILVQGTLQSPTTCCTTSASNSQTGWKDFERCRVGLVVSQTSDDVRQTQLYPLALTIAAKGAQAQLTLLLRLDCDSDPLQVPPRSASRQTTKSGMQVLSRPL